MHGCAPCWRGVDANTSCVHGRVGSHVTAAEQARLRKMGEDGGGGGGGLSLSVPTAPREQRVCFRAPIWWSQTAFKYEVQKLSRLRNKRAPSVSRVSVVGSRPLTQGSKNLYCCTAQPVREFPCHTKYTTHSQANSGKHVAAPPNATYGTAVTLYARRLHPQLHEKPLTKTKFHSSRLFYVYYDTTAAVPVHEYFVL